MLSNSLVFANTRPEVIVFVSFSMPSTAIKLWMKEAITYDASVNIRGLIGNQFPQTMATVQKLINENDNQGGTILILNFLNNITLRKFLRLLCGKPRKTMRLMWCMAQVRLKRLWRLFDKIY